MSTRFGGIDVGGTKIHAIVTDGAGTVVGEHTVATRPGPDEVVADAVDALRAAAGGPDCAAGLRSVGVGIPGRVDPATGIVSHAVNLGVTELHLADRLAAELGVPVAVDNDVKAAALGAARYLGVHDEPLSYLNVGTGLAMATVHRGRIRRGDAGFAGEIGHLAVSGSGITCTCGQIGCLETVASGSGILRRWQQHHPSSPAADLDAAVEAGDPVAAGIWDDAVRNAAAAIKVVVLTIDPALVAVGGGLAHSDRDLVAEVTRYLARESARSPFLASLEIPARLRLIPRAAQVAATGAALLGRAALDLPDRQDHRPESVRV